MKKIFFMLLLACFAQHSMGQEAATQSRNGHVTLLRKNAAMIYLGSGLQNRNAANPNFKTSSGILDLNIFAPFYSSKKFSLGINAGFDYSLSTKETLPSPSKPNGYNVYGQDSLSPVITEKSTFTKGTSFGIAAGPQFNYWVSNKFILSPIMHFGYTKNSSAYMYEAVQNTNFNGTPYTFELLNIKHTNTAGLGLIPKLRFHYMFTKNIGLWAEGSYMIGPKTKTEIKTFTPSGQPGEGGYYEIGNLQEGVVSVQNYSSSNNGWAVKGGIVISIGGKKPILQNEDLNTPSNNSTSSNVNCSTPTILTSNCEGGFILFNIQQSWTNQSASGILTILPTYLDTSGSPRAINVNISGNSTSLNAANGSRNFLIAIPNSYQGQQICFKTRIQSGRNATCVSEVCAIADCAPSCNVKLDSNYCIDRRGYVTFTSSWNNSNPNDFLFITIKANGVAISGLNIPNNNTAINNNNGNRSFTVEIPNNYAGQTITVEQNICKPTNPPSNCCSKNFSFTAKDCFICENCSSVVSRIQSAGKIGTNFIITANITSTYPIVKIVAELESVTATNLPTPPTILPNPNFEFLNTSSIGGIAVTMPFSLYNLRSNIVVSNISASTSVPVNLVIDNMNSKTLKTYKIKLIVFMNDGSRCERYISSEDRIYGNSTPIPNR